MKEDKKSGLTPELKRLRIDDWTREGELPAEHPAPERNARREANELGATLMMRQEKSDI